MATAQSVGIREALGITDVRQFGEKHREWLADLERANPEFGKVMLYFFAQYWTRKTGDIPAIYLVMRKGWMIANYDRHVLAAGFTHPVSHASALTAA